MATKTLRGPNGIRLELDQSKVIPNDPGADTPAMVYKGEFSATYWCACGEGELITWRSGATKQLTERELNWLHEQDEIVNQFLYHPCENGGG